MLSRLVLLIAMLVGLPLCAGAAPKVVVSIAPIHSLVAGVMGGVAEPELLVDGRRSPHDYMLKPSQMSALHDADVIIWTGGVVEGFLPKVLRSVASDQLVVELMDVEGVNLLAARSGGEWHNKNHVGEDHYDYAHKGMLDGHIWLDPHNAMQIVKVVRDALVESDPKNSSVYRENSQRLFDELAALDKELQARLKPLSAKPYLVFHDAYQYLEARYGLNGIGAISVNPERKPGAKRIKEIRQKIAESNVRCIFGEPQFSNSILKTVVDGSGAKLAVLDPMGADLPAGKSFYFELMRGLGKQFEDCLND